MIIICIHI